MAIIGTGMAIDNIHPGKAMEPFISKGASPWAHAPAGRSSRDTVIHIAQGAVGGAESIKGKGISLVVTFLAEKMVSFIMTSTPFPRADGWAARRMAFSRFMGPSALTAVAGRMAPVLFRGMEGFTVSWRNQAVFPQYQCHG